MCRLSLSDRDPERHAVAMRERERRDFHHELTALRFRVLGEVGQWCGRRGYVPELPAD